MKMDILLCQLMVLDLDNDTYISEEKSNNDVLLSSEWYPLNVDLYAYFTKYCPYNGIWLL